MKKTLRLFVSSTFKDFECERRDLMCGIFPDLAKKLNDKGVSFLPIDLRWGVTEDAARLGKTMDICLSEVERACTTDPPPDFLLLLGNRYGWRPLPSVISENDFKEFSKKYGALGGHYELDLNTKQTLLGDCQDGIYRLKDASFGCEALRSDLDKCVIAHESLTHFKKVYYAGSATHQEFEIATKIQQEQKGKKSDEKSQLIVFLRNDSSEIDEDLPPELKELGLGVEAFKKQVNNYKISNKYSLVTFNVWEDTKEHLASLDSIIGPSAAKSTGKDQKAADDFIESSCKTLVGRDQELSELITICQTEIGCRAVIGESGAGKSAVMAALAKNLKARENKDRLLLYRFIGIDEDCGTEQDLLASLIQELNQKHSIADSELPEDPRAYDSEFLRILADHQSRKFIFLLDALNQLSGERRLSWLQSLPDNVFVLVSVIEDVNSRFENKFMLNAVNNPTAIVKAHLKPYNRILTKDQEQELADTLAGKNALHLTLIALSLRNLRSEELMPVFPGTLSGMLDELHGKLCQSHFPHLVNRVLSLLLVPRYGVTEEEIAIVSNKDHGLRLLLENHAHHPLAKSDPIPPVLWASLWQDLRPYIAVRNRHEVELLTFMHSAFVAHYSNWFAQEHTARLLSKAYSAEIFKDGEEDAIHETIHPHVLEEIIGVLVKSDSDKSRECMEKLLIDLDFIRQRGAAGQVYDLLADYNDVLDSWPGYDRYSPFNRNVISTSRNGMTSCDAKEITSDNLEKSPVGRIELANQFVLECQQSLSHAKDCPTVVVEQAHRRYRSRWLAKAADSKMQEWGEQRPKPFMKYLSSSRPNHGDFPSAEILSFEGHDGPVNCIALTSDGMRMISAGSDKTLKLWDLNNGKKLQSFVGHTQSVSHVALTTDEKRIISACNDGILKVWDLETGKRIFDLVGHKSIVYNVALTPDGRRAISAGCDNILIFWDLEFGLPIREMTGHTNPVCHVVITPNGKYAVSASHDHTLIMWDLDSGKPKHNLVGHSDQVTRAILTSDGMRAISASKDKSIKVWNLETGKIIRTLPMDSNEINCILLSPDDNHVLASDDCNLKIWDLNSGILCSNSLAHSKQISCVAMTSDGLLGVSASYDNTIKIWDLSNGKQLHVVSANDQMVLHIAISPDGNRAVSASHAGTIKEWNLAIPFSLHRGKKIVGHDWTISHLAFSAYAKRAVSSSHDDTIKVWNLENGDFLFDIRCKHAPYVAFTADGQKVIFSEKAEAIKVYNLESHEQCQIPGDGYGYSCHLELTQDGRLAVTACDDNTLKVWDLENNVYLYSLKGHISRVRHVALTPDGRRAISASDDKTLRVWDLYRKDSRILKLDEHTSMVWHVAVTPDGKCAVSASIDNTLRVWNLESGKCIHVLQGHETAVLRIVVTPDGRRSVSAGKDGTIKIWDLQTGIFLGDIHKHGGGDSIFGTTATSLAVSLDGRYVVSSGHDNILNIWSIDNKKSVNKFFVKPGWIGIGTQPALVGCESSDCKLRFYHNDFSTHQKNTEIFYSILIEDSGETIFICPSCGQRNDAPQEVINCIKSLMSKHPKSYESSESPCLTLPEEAWNMGALLSGPADENYFCKRCKCNIRFNPWIVNHHIEVCRL